ncbi:MAG: VRR-NUC domain-containing protein [Candidatus Aenigmatarchaeota archaeon]
MRGIKICLEEEVIYFEGKHNGDKFKVECLAENYYRDKGYNIIREKYDILKDAKNPNDEIGKNNKTIEGFFKSLGKGKELEILKAVNGLRGGGNSGQPDIFAYKDESDWFFAEVKSDNDKLRDDQMIIFALLKLILGCEENKNLKVVRVTAKQDCNREKKKTETFVVALHATDTK